MSKFLIQNSPSSENYRVLKGPALSKGRGCSWGSLRILTGKIGEPNREHSGRLGESPPPPKQNPMRKTTQFVSSSKTLGSKINPRNPPPVFQPVSQHAKASRNHKRTSLGHHCHPRILIKFSPPSCLNSLLAFFSMGF